MMAVSSAAVAEVNRRMAGSVVERNLWMLMVVVVRLFSSEDIVGPVTIKLPKVRDDVGMVIGMVRDFGSVFCKVME